MGKVNHFIDTIYVLHIFIGFQHCLFHFIDVCKHRNVLLCGFHTALVENLVNIQLFPVDLTVIDELGAKNNAPRHSNIWEQEKSDCAQSTLPICTAMASMRNKGTKRIARH